MTAKYELLEIPMDKIYPSKDNPRRTFNEDRLKELAESIKNVDLLEEISVRSTGNGDYEIINGERRFRAETLVGAKTLRVKVYHVDELTAQEMRLTELSQMEQVDQVEIENAVYFYWKAKGEPIYKELEAMTGFNEKTIGHYIRAGQERFESSAPSFQAETLEVSAGDLSALRPIKDTKPHVYQAYLTARANDIITQERLRELVKEAIEIDGETIEQIKHNKTKRKTAQELELSQEEQGLKEHCEPLLEELLGDKPKAEYDVISSFSINDAKELDRWENERAMADSLLDANIKVASTVKWELVKDIKNEEILNKCVSYVATIHRLSGNFLKDAGFSEIDG